MTRQRKKHEPITETGAYQGDKVRRKDGLRIGEIIDFYPDIFNKKVARVLYPDGSKVSMWASSLTLVEKGPKWPKCKDD